MKSTLFVWFACCLLTASCKKQTPEKTWQGRFTATMDSVPVSFAVRLDVDNRYSSISGKYSLQVTAYHDQSGDQFEILASDSTKLTVGRYCEDGSTNTRTARLVYNEKGQAYPFMSSNSGSYPATITINILQDDRVEGSFSGDVYLLNYVPPNFLVTSTRKRIVNGTFDLKFQ